MCVEKFSAFRKVVLQGSGFHSERLEIASPMMFGNVTFKASQACGLGVG